MKNKIVRISLFILFISIIAGGVLFVFRGQILSHYTPTVEQTGNIRINVKSDTSYVSSNLIVSNRSFLRIELDTIKYKISLFGKTYLESVRFLGVVLPGHGIDTIDFSLIIPFRAILNDLRDQRKKGDSAGYSINISLQYSTFFGEGEFPVNKSAKIKIPQPPDLEIQGIKFEKIRLKSIMADVMISVVNYSSVTLAIKEMTYLMKISEQGKLQGKYSEPFRIKPNGTTLLKLPIEISVNNIGKTIFDIIINKDTYDYTLTLSADLESPGRWKEYFHINLNQNGKMELKK